MIKTEHSGRMEPEGRTADKAATTTASRCGMRYLLIALGWTCVALGAVGLVVPGMPTTVFLLIALWAFSKSSERFRVWLYEHPRFGPPLRDWHAHGVIPPRAKAAALLTMSASLAILIATAPWHVPAIVGAVMAPVAAFILSRPSRPAGAAHPNPGRLGSV